MSLIQEKTKSFEASSSKLKINIERKEKQKEKPEKVWFVLSQCLTLTVESPLGSAGVLGAAQQQVRPAALPGAGRGAAQKAGQALGRRLSIAPTKSEERQCCGAVG